MADRDPSSTAPTASRYPLRSIAANATTQQTTGTAASSAPAAGHSAAAGGDHSDDDADEGKAADDAASDSEDIRIAIANMQREMKALREENARLRGPAPAAAAAQQAPSPIPGAAQLQQQQTAPSPGTADIAALARLLQESQAQQAEQARLQQLAQTRQLMLLQSLPDLALFSGKGADTTLAANEWLNRAEDYFALKENALGVTAEQGDAARVLVATNALSDDARRWFHALPAGMRPTTWEAFRVAMKARFCSVPDERIRVEKLEQFVHAAAPAREKLNIQGLQAYTARFLQLAGEIPDEYTTQHTKLALLVRALPKRSVAHAFAEGAKKPMPKLHEIVNTILSKAANSEYSLMHGGPAGAVAGAAPLSLDAVSTVAHAFGWTREEASRHLEDNEGWAPHETDGRSPAAAGGQQAVGSTPRSSTEHQELLKAISALTAKVGAGPAAGERKKSRRDAPPEALKGIPEELRESRRNAGLCMKCGVAKYEGGSRGHNSRTCKEPADKTTSAAEGRKKADF